MQLSGDEKRELREALAQAFPQADYLKCVVSDADIGKSWEDLRFSADSYSGAIMTLIDYSLSGPGRLERLLQEAVREAPDSTRLRKAFERIQELAREEGNVEQKQREAIRARYLKRLIERFDVFSARGAAAEDFEQLSSAPRDGGLPLLVAEAPGLAEGRPLTGFLAPGARLVVVAEYPDGLVPLLHQALVECARESGAAKLEAHLPIVYSEDWGVPGVRAWEPSEREEVKPLIAEEQERCIAEGRALVFFDVWDAEDMAKSLEICARHPSNIVVVGARPDTSPPGDYKRLYPCPLARSAKQRIAEMWLESGDATTFLDELERKPVMAEAARSPYLLTVMSIAQRLRLEEAAIWAGRRSGGRGGTLIPARAMDGLLRVMWGQKELPGRLRGREMAGSYPELDKYARQVFLLFRNGDDCVRLEAPGANPTGMGLETAVKSDAFVTIARSTGLFVPATRDGAPVLEPLHPALWSALAARGLWLDRNSYSVPSADKIDEGWVALVSRAADLMKSESRSGDVDDSECGNWLRALCLRRSRALGLAAISRSVAVPSSGIPRLLGLRQLPDKFCWSGYRPDRWRALEAKLRTLASLPTRAREDLDVVRLLRRLVRDAHSFDLAIIRRCLSIMRLKYTREGRSPPDEFEEFWNVRRFFELARRPLATEFIDWTPIPEEEGVLIGASERDTDAWDNERPLHRVRVPAFQMSTSTVTNAQYMKFDPNWRAQQESEASPLPDRWEELPAVRVSWYEAWIFAEWMEARLPGEIQWERAAWGNRAAMRDDVPYWFSKDRQFHSAVWYRGNSTWGSSKIRMPHPAGEHPKDEEDDFDPRPFGLHDMLGNVWEWCEDEQGYEYKDGPVFTYERPHQVQGDRPSYLVNHVIRGGSWDSEKEDCRCSVRQFAYPAVRSDVIGFRLVRNS